MSQKLSRINAPSCWNVHSTSTSPDSQRTPCRQSARSYESASWTSRLLTGTSTVVGGLLRSRTGSGILALE